MSLKQEIYDELMGLSERLWTKARSLSEAGDDRAAQRAITLAKMCKIWAEEWK